jgi:phenylacetate-CoA ligase
VKKAFSKKNLWENTPAGLKRILGAGLSLVPLPYLLGGDFRRWRQFALEADRWDGERLREYQLAELRRVLTLAYEKTEYYRQTFRSVGFQPGDLKSLEDLQRLPTIDKVSVRENWERMLTRPITDRSVDLVTTGGTSGEPMRFYMNSSRHAPEFGHLTSCWSRVGYQPGDVFAVLRGRVITKPTDGMYYQYDPLFRYHFYSTFHMSPDDLRKYLAHMNRVQPKFIHAYPSSLFALVEFAAAEGLTLPKSIRAALFESEALFPHQRELFRSKIPGVRIFSCYGHSEKLVMAAQCEKSDEYHVAPTYGFCEVLKEDGSPAANGEQGEITGTGFINEVMPLIRYRTKDGVTRGGNKCGACGREHLMLREIQGRWGQEFLVCRDGHTLISMTSLNLHDDTFDGIMRFQFQQSEPGKVLLKLVPAKTAQLDAGKFQRHFKPKLAHGIDLDVQYVKEIPLTRVGKQPMIDQRCPMGNPNGRPVEAVLSGNGAA